MKVHHRDPAAPARRRSQTIAGIGAAVAVGTASLMVLVAPPADQAAVPGRATSTQAPPTTNDVPSTTPSPDPSPAD